MGTAQYHPGGEDGTVGTGRGLETRNGAAAGAGETLFHFVFISIYFNLTVLY